MIHIPDSLSEQQDSESGSAVNPGGVVVSVFISMLLLSFCGWLGYAYFNPNTASGRFLIKYRPGAWRWRQSGGRYTAASIHMTNAIKPPHKNIITMTLCQSGS